MTPSTEAAKAAIDRLGGALTGQVTVALEGPPGADTFTLSERSGRAHITGSSPVALISGFNWYLRKIAHGQVSRVGDNLPSRAPLPEASIRLVSPYSDRYLYNFTVNGYTSPYWTWSEWEREIDLAASHGVNRALVTTGLEQVWIETFTGFGYREQELRGWISSLSLQPFQWLGTLSGIGPSPTPEVLVRRVELGQRIVRRLRDLGIEPVLPGYAGLVPPTFAERNAGAHVVPQGQWGPFDRPDWLATDTDWYAQVAARYYETQQALFGVSPFQAVDLLHEGGTVGEVDLQAAAKGVEAALRDAFGPSYRWVIQAWEHNPYEELLAAVDVSRLLVLDLATERVEKWKQTNAFHEAPWALGILANAGGRPGLYGDAADLWQRVPATLRDPTRGKLAGIAVMLEGLQNHDLVQAALSDLVWQSDQRDVDEWIEEYVTARYGSADPDALAGWRLLLGSAYASWADWPSGADSLFCARPSLDAKQTTPFAPSACTYDPSQVQQALRRLLDAAPRLGAVDTYQYDVVDVARQVLVDRARVLLPELKTLYTQGKADAFKSAAEGFLDVARRADRLLGTRREFLLEPWLAQAERWGSTPAERAALRADAARLVTVWGDRPAPDWVEDYAHRDWAGLLSTYYIPRWERYLSALVKALRSSGTPPTFNWFTEGKRWAENPPRTAAVPTGDPLEAAAAVLDAMQDHRMQLATTFEI